MNEAKNQNIRIAVCVCTYYRPKGLERLLASLDELIFIKNKTPEWFVVVVDNDPNGSAEGVVERTKKTFNVPIFYGIEQNRGIASARNRAVQLAEGSDFIVFIDDDETADKEWLDELLFLQGNMDADLVSGPVSSVFEEPTAVPDWIKNGRFFDRKRFSDGHKLSYAATGNLLIKTKWTIMAGGPFDVRFNRTGGEDTMFSNRIIKKGALCVWADNALVYEYVSPNRVSANWILKRSLRIGWTIARVEMLNKESQKIIALRAIKMAAHIFLGVFLAFPFLIIYGYAGLIKSLQILFRGIGELYCFLGKEYHEYG